MGVRDFALLLLLILIWGFTFVVIQVGLEGIPPIFLACIRFFLTSFPAVFFFKRPQAAFYKIALYGLVMFALMFVLFFTGMYLGVPAGLASILLQIQVFFSLLFSFFLFHEKIKIWQIVGALIAFVGIFYAGCNLGSSISLPGFLLLIGAAASWGLGNVISKKLGKVNMISLVVWSSMVAWPLLLLFSFCIEGPDQIVASCKNISWLSIACILYLTYLSTFFGYGIWSFLIHRYSIAMIVPFTLLEPVIGMASAVLLLCEPLELWKIGSSLLVMGGMGIYFLGPRFFGKKRDKESFFPRAP